MDQMVEIDEGRMKDIFTANQEGKSAKEIAKQLKLPLSTVKSILGEGKEEILEFTDSQLDVLARQYAGLKGKTISVDNANKLRKIFDRIPDRSLDALRRKKIPFLSGLALSRMVQKGMPVKEDKDEPELKPGKGAKIGPAGKIALAKEKDTDALEAQLTTAKGQIELLKTKLENEKNKAVKPEPNKETGEVPLTVGIAHKYLKDKAEKEKDKKDVKEAFAVQVTKKDGGKFIHGSYKTKEEAEKFVKWYKTGDVRTTKKIEVVKEMAKDDAYAIGMAQAKKSMNDEPPLEKKTITKGHEIAKKILAKEARWQIEGQLGYRGIGSYDGFHMVIDAPNERAAEQKAYKELDKARARKKIGPGGGGSVEDVDIESIERTSNRLEAPSTYKVSEYNPSVKESTPDPIKYGPDKVAKAMKIAVKSDGNYSGAVREIEKIAKDLSKVSTIARALKTANEDKELDERGGANTSTRQGSFARSRKPKYRFGYRVAEKEPEGEKELEEIRIRPKRVVEMSPAEKKKRLQRAKDMIKFYHKQKQAILKGPNKELAKKYLKSDLTKSQIKKVHKKADELPKKSFRDQYGKKKGDSVRYAVATNQTKKELGLEDQNTDILPKSQEPTQKTDPMNIQTKEPEKKKTDNGTKSDKIDVNPRIDYHA